MLLAACGSSNASTNASSSSRPGFAAGLRFSDCMRSHGVPNFPDPTVHDNAHSKGVGFNLAASGSGAIDTHSPVFRSANAACEKATGFGHISQAQLQQAMAGLLKFAECMRSHGITNFPDPFENSHQVGFNTTGLDTSSPRFKAAMAACRALLPGGGP